MNAVIHILTPFINGALFDAFEYYAHYYMKDKSTYLFFVQSNNFRPKNYMDEKEIKRIFLDKYDLPEDIFDNVVFLTNQNKIIYYTFDKVLILDNHTYHYLDGLIKANEYHIIVDPFIPSKVNYKELEKRDKHFLYSELLLYKDELLEDT